jgi:hypothetical protein
MSKICFFNIMLSTLFLLSSCIPLPVIGWTPVLLVTSGPKDLDQKGYSLGPVSSEQFPDLIERAIPPSEGTVHLFGRAELKLLLDNRSYSLTVVASLSDTDILLLQWYDPEEQYKLMARLPYSEIQSVSKNERGFGRVIYLCLANMEFAWGDQSHEIGQRASMSFTKPSGFFQDIDRTKAALYLLQERIEPIDGACDEPTEATDGAIEAALQEYSGS